MNLSKILGVILVLLSILFLGLQFQALEIEASGVKALALTSLVVIYAINVKDKHPLFFAFLIVFALAEIFNYITWVGNFDVDPNFDYFYFIGNGLYVLAYTFLIFRILAGINILDAIAKFPFQIFLLVVLSVFVVQIITETTKKELNPLEYNIELLYNAVLMFLMSLSLINYIYKDSKKSINLLIGSICIVFSETLQLAYFYISDENVLNLLCSLFFVAAFLFFYLQSRLLSKHVKVYEQQQELNV
jgi:hypothetical protein